MIIAILCLGVPALAFLYIVHRIIRGNSREVMRYDNPDGYNRMVEDERAERSGKFKAILIGGAIIAVLVLMNHCHAGTDLHLLPLK